MPQTKERRKELYKKNREAILERQRQYLRDHPEKAKEYNRRSYWGNPEARKSHRKAYYSANQATERIRMKEYNVANKEAISEQRKEHYQENKDSILAAVRGYQESHRDSMLYIRKRILINVRHRAKKLGIPFNLTLDDIVIPDKCPVFGTPFDFGVKGGKPSPHSPSMDKILPKGGYLKGNTQIISHRANALKGDATLEDLRKLVEFMEKINKTAIS